MKLLNYNNILCISAHPDDAEYGMLGTIIKHLDTTFHMVCLGHGGEHDDSTGPARSRELWEIWNAVDNMQGYEPPFSIVDTVSESTLINYIESNINTQYDCVMIPPITDTHFEHRKLHDVGMALVRKNRAAVIEYKTPSTLNTWIPNLYVDIGTQLPVKVLLLQNFLTQTTSFYFEDSTISAFHIDYQCKKRGIDNVESFKILSSYI